MHASVPSVEDNLEGSVNNAVKKLEGMYKTSVNDAEEDSMHRRLQRNTASIVDRSYRIARHIAQVAEESS